MLRRITNRNNQGVPVIGRIAAVDWGEAVTAMFANKAKVEKCAVLAETVWLAGFWDESESNDQAPPSER